jgi:hypothetical protein
MTFNYYRYVYVKDSGVFNVNAIVTSVEFPRVKTVVTQDVGGFFELLAERQRNNSD